MCADSVIKLFKNYDNKNFRRRVENYKLFKTGFNCDGDRWHDWDEEERWQQYLAHDDGDIIVDGHEKTIRFNAVVRVFVHDRLDFDQVVGPVEPHIAAVVQRNARDPRVDAVAVVMS